MKPTKYLLNKMLNNAAHELHDGYLYGDLKVELIKKDSDIHVTAWLTNKEGKALLELEKDIIINKYANGEFYFHKAAIKMEFEGIKYESKFEKIQQEEKQEDNSSSVIKELQKLVAFLEKEMVIKDEFIKRLLKDIDEKKE